MSLIIAFQSKQSICTSFVFLLELYGYTEGVKNIEQVCTNRREQKEMRYNILHGLGPEYE